MCVNVVAYLSPNLTFVNPAELGPFHALRTIASTGAPLTPPVFEWTQTAFGSSKIHIISVSGGTDICGSCTQPIRLLSHMLIYLQLLEVHPASPSTAVVSIRHPASHELPNICILRNPSQNPRPQS